MVDTSNIDDSHDVNIDSLLSGTTDWVMINSEDGMILRLSPLFYLVYIHPFSLSISSPVY